MTIQDRLIPHINNIIELYNSGISTNKIAEMYSCNSYYIWKLLKISNISVNSRQKFIGKISDYTLEIIKLFDDGVSAYKISKKLNISKPTILRVLKESNRNTSLKNKVNKNNLLKDLKDTVIKLHNEGLSQFDISEITGHNQANICRLLQKLEIPAHPPLYSVDETYFDKIDNHAKAWVLGWFYSDGCVDVAGKMRISIQERDRYILERIKQEMKYTGPLYNIPPKTERHQPQVCLCINRKVLADALIKLNCVPNKSLILEFPNEDIVPKEFMNSFILGMWQGDGSISKRGNVSITSTDKFNIVLKDILSKMGLYSTYYYRRKNKCTCGLVINRQEDSKVFLDWIHHDAPFIMTRKYERYQALCNRLADKLT